jgi:hypothetical protein
MEMITRLSSMKSCSQSSNATDRKRSYSRLGDGKISSLIILFVLLLSFTQKANAQDIVITQQPSTAPQVLCNGEAPTTLSVTVDTSNSGWVTPDMLQYQWYWIDQNGDWNSISGAYSDTYTPDPTDLNLNGTLSFAVEIVAYDYNNWWSAYVSSDISGPITFNVAIAISGNTTDYNTVSLSASGGSQYLWSGGATPNSDSNVFDQSGDYTIQVTDGSGCVGQQTIPVKVYFAAPIAQSPVIDTQPSSSNALVCRDGVAADLTVAASPATPGETLTYQWYVSNSPTSNYSAIGGATNPSFTPLSNTNGTSYYFVEVTSSAGYAIDSQVSGAITIASPAISIAGATTNCNFVNLVASGGATYAWDAGSTPNTAANTFSSSGTINLSVADINGCITTTSRNIVVIPFTGSPKPISIYNPDFTAAYEGGWQLNANAIFNGNPPSYLRLTPDGYGQAGSAFWKKKLALSTNFSFSVYYEFAMTPTTDPADGLTFCIQQATNTAGGAGGGLGYDGLPGQSIAIEYDTYTNGGDPNNNHMALDVNGKLHGNGGYQFPNEAPYRVIPPLNLWDGATKYNWVDYDGINNVLEVRISNTPIRPASPTMQIPNLSLASIFPNGDVFFGFTAATGAAKEEHAINVFYANNVLDPFPSNAMRCMYTQASVNLALTSSNDIDCGNITSDITITSTDRDGTPAGATLNLTVDSGSATLTPEQITTDPITGIGHVTLSNLSSDNAIIRATSTEGGAFEKVTVTRIQGAILSGAMSACGGTTSQLTASIPGGTWSSTNLNIATVDAAGLVTAGLVSGDAVITYAPGGSACPISGTFSVVSMEFNNQPNVTSNTPPTINVSMTNASGDITHYKWYVNTSNNTSGGTLLATHINSAKSDQFVPSSPDASKYYYCVVDNTSSCSIVSQTIQLTALPIIKSGETPIDHVEVLVVAGGGGGGGSYAGGGGGAGGLIHESSYSISSNGSYTITVGAGGSGSGYGTVGLSGNNSQFGSNLVAVGGGGGGTCFPSQNGLNGGSGGGGGYGSSSGGLKTSGQGQDGSSFATAGFNSGGAGGGAGAPGDATVNGPVGGAGLAYTISGISTYYAGGGGAGSDGTGGAGGIGGGGAGGSPRLSGIAATPNTGGGGGGGGGHDTAPVGGNGGSGIVIVKYLGSPSAIGGIISQVGGYTIHTFTNIGTTSITFSSAYVNVGETKNLTCAISGGAWSSADINIASVDPSTGVVTGVAGGQTIINYTYTDSFSQSIQITYTITVIASPSLTNFGAQVKTLFESTYTIIPPTTLSSGALTYSSSNPAVATIVGTTVTLNGSGVTTITANQAGDGTYFDASISATLTVNSISLVTKNGGVTTSNPNYVSRNGGLGGYTGLSINGEVKHPLSSTLITSGLLLHLDAQDSASYPGSGSTWNDISGNNHDGTLYSAVFSNDNGRSYFDFSNSSIITPIPKSPSMTFSSWARSTNFSSNMLFNSGDDGSGPDLFFMGGTVSWNTWDSDANSFNFSTSSIDANWHCYTVVNDAAAGAILYFDGIQVGTAAYRASTYTTNLYIGAASNGGYGWDGSIATFLAYNRVLSPAEVAQNFNAQRSRFTNSPSVALNGLILNLDAGNSSSYPGTGTTWSDLSGNSNNSTLIGGAVFDGANGGSILFDGSTGYISGTIAPISSSDFTVDFWINPTTSANYNNQISFNTNSDWTTFVYHNANGGGVYVGTSTGDRFNPIVGTMTANIWQNCSFTYSNKLAAFYVNGVLIETATFSSLPSVATISSYFIGQPTANTINGKIAKFMVYNRGLTSSEVQQNFNATKSRFGL